MQHANRSGQTVAVDVGHTHTRDRLGSIFRCGLCTRNGVDRWIIDCCHRYIDVGRFCHTTRGYRVGESRHCPIKVRSRRKVECAVSLQGDNAIGDRDAAAHADRRAVDSSDQMTCILEAVVGVNVDVN